MVDRKGMTKIKVLLVVVLAILVGSVASLFIANKEEPKPSGTVIYPPPENVYLSLNRDTFTSGETLILKIVNNGTEQVTLGERYVIQYLHETEWMHAAWVTPNMWIAIGYWLQPGGSHKQEIVLFPVYAGTYRVLKEVRVDDEKATLIATFQVIEGTPEEEIPRAYLPEQFWREFYSLCSSNQPKMDRREVIDTIKEMLRRQREQMPDFQTFFINYGIYDEGTYNEGFHIDVRHATKEFLARWPDQCLGVPIRVTVFSWALTEPEALQANG